MQTIIICLVVFAPLLGFLCYRYLRISTIATILMSLAILGLFYLIVYFTDTRVIGEEGDWTPFILAFVLYNIIIFQLLRPKKQVWIRTIFTAAVVASMALSLHSGAVLTIYFFKHVLGG